MPLSSDPDARARQLANIRPGDHQASNREAHGAYSQTKLAPLRELVDTRDVGAVAAQIAATPAAHAGKTYSQLATAAGPPTKRRVPRLGEERVPRWLGDCVLLLPLIGVRGVRRSGGAAAVARRISASVTVRCTGAAADSRRRLRTCSSGEGRGLMHVQLTWPSCCLRAEAEAASASADSSASAVASADRAAAARRLRRAGARVASMGLRDKGEPSFRLRWDRIG